MMNKNRYKSAIDNIRFSDDLSTKTLDYVSSHVSQPEEDKVIVKERLKKLYPVFITVACAVVLIVSMKVFGGNSDFELPNSVGNVSVKYINKAPSIKLSTSLIELTEDELFNKYNTDIFMGKIEDIKNIKIDFNGSKEYSAIANIRIEKIYRGHGTVGDVVSVLIPCPINTNVYVTDTEIVSSMRIGMTGIFMPMKYDETSYREENGAKIYLMDIAGYGFLDGERFAFLNSDNGLIFNKQSYESIASATTLEEIESYIMNMIE